MTDKTFKTADGKHVIVIKQSAMYRGYFPVHSYNINESGELEFHWSVGNFKTEAQAIRASRRFAKSEFGCALQA